MKTDTKIHQIKNELEEKKLRLNSQLESVNHEINRLQEQCPHSIVFKFDDNEEIEKIGKIYLCYCPSCGKKENIYISHKLERTSFKNSRIIDLSELIIDNYNDTFEIIQNEIFDHAEYYYNENVPTKQLSETMTKVINLRIKEIKKTKRVRKFYF